MTLERHVIGEDVIGGTQWSSVAISGHQWSSGVTQWSSEGLHEDLKSE